jgi:hypothetical protein
MTPRIVTENEDKFLPDFILNMSLPEFDEWLRLDEEEIPQLAYDRGVLESVYYSIHGYYELNTYSEYVEQLINSLKNKK